MAVEADFYAHLFERITESEFAEGPLALGDLQLTMRRRE